jgi:Spy/CpxP family protein refolding chaperone
MKSQKTKFAGILVAALLMIVGTNLQAQNDGPPQRQERGKQEMHQRGPQGKQGESGPRGPRIPNLSEAQESQLKTIHINAEKASLPIKNEVGEKEARLKTLTTSADFDAKAVNKVIDEIGSLKSDLMKLKVASTQEVKSILTEEQLLFFNKQIGAKRGPQGQQQGRKR